MAFITVDEFRSMALPVTDKQWDMLTPDKIQATLASATQHVKDYLERDIEETEYIERIHGNSRPKLMVNNYPLVSIQGVSAIDAHGYSRTHEASEFLVDSRSGIIEWLDRYRNNWFQNYLWTVEYTAGYSAIPGPIKHATSLVALQMLQPLFRGGTNFASIDLVDESNEHIVDVLERYRRVRIG